MLRTARTDQDIEALRAARAQLVAWLTDDAYPRWARRGVDRHGGFVETLDQRGEPRLERRRVGVQTRQLYAFANAAAFEWRVDVRALLRGGLTYLDRNFMRADGYLRTLIAPNGAVLDDRALLYDQAFALLAYAALAAALNAQPEFERRALKLRDLIERDMRASDGAFASQVGGVAREANPHMHLLEACLAWWEIGTDPSWQQWALELAELAVTRFIRADSGVLGESYGGDWRPSAGIAGRVIEPGHHYAWAWLLTQMHPAVSLAPVLRLIEIAEKYGVHQGVAVNSLYDDCSVRDPRARLWPQTERLKATLAAAERTGDLRFLAAARAAAESLLGYFNPQTPGLWFDERGSDGQILPSVTSAATLYHLVGAIRTLNYSPVLS